MEHKLHKGNLLREHFFNSPGDLQIVEYADIKPRE